MSKPLRKWSAVRQGEYVRVTLGRLTTRGLASAAEARGLAAELVQAADEVEPEPEQSCFTCMHDKTETRDGRVAHACDQAENEPEVWVYVEASGASDSLDGMPTDRSIPCPCWSAKVTT